MYPAAKVGLFGKDVPMNEKGRQKISFNCVARLVFEASLREEQLKWV